jgi:acetyl/propionyl-CoA carboxylase alpha subunit
MRRTVNGVEIELDAVDVDVDVFQTSDRLLVRGSQGTASAVAVRQGDRVLVSYLGRQFVVEERPRRARSGAVAGTGEIHAPMPGQIVDILVESGAEVVKGQKLIVLEAMKTQQAFVAPFDGVVGKVAVEKGAQVAEGALLATVEAPGE